MAARRGTRGSKLKQELTMESTDEEGGSVRGSDSSLSSLADDGKEGSDFAPGSPSGDEADPSATPRTSSTPDTSVYGDSKSQYSTSVARSSGAAAARTPRSWKAVESGSDAESSDEPLAKKTKLDSNGRSAARKGANALGKKTTTPILTSANTSSSSKRRRRPSPEVVVYTKRSSGSSTVKEAAHASTVKTDAASAAHEASSSPASKAASRSIGRKAALKPHGDDSEDDCVSQVKDESSGDDDDDDDGHSTKTKIAGRNLAYSSKGKGAADKGKRRADAEQSPASKTSRASSAVAASARRTLAKLKKGKMVQESTAKADLKGKGKKTEWTDDDDSEGSDFKLDSDDLESEEEAQSTEAGSSDDDDDGDEDSGDELARLVQDGSPAAAMQNFKKMRAKRVKRGPKEKKLTWWQKNELALEAWHPELQTVWSDLKLLPVIQPTAAEQPEGLSMSLLPFQKEGLYWMLEQEKGPWNGGMLADEMGMGKTIQTISLILSDYVPGTKKHTLVLAPTVAIMQWRNEFTKFTSGMKVCVWHGGNRSNDKKELLKYDVILTSYAVLESSFRRQNTGYKRKGELLKEESVLHSIDWHRVILDEAHNIKDRSCNTARGAFALKSKFRWCLSGTPLQNRVGELYSLIRFLGAEPFSYYFCKKCPCRSLHWKFSNKRTCDDCGHTPMHHICYWNNEILKPIQKYGATLEGHGSKAFEKLALLLSRMMLRRTKVERADDMGLPPRDVMVRRDYFTEEEEEFYSSLYSDVKRTFSTYVAADSLLNNYANVFQLLTRMRQTACHPDLVLKGRTAKALLGESLQNAQLSFSTCRLCLDEGDDPIMSKCRHVFCRECIRQYLQTAVEVVPECPVCHLPLTIDLAQETSEELLQARHQGMLEKVDPGKWRTSTKIEALVEELSKLRTEDHSIKSLVFSQFTSFLDLIARRLQLAGFKIARLQGSMTPEARDRTVKHFMNTTDCTVFLLSLKAGGVALNLTEASRVFIMDPWWNPSAEVQAMDRIHRIGQHRPVIVKRLIIENSIESKIVELQKKKEHMTGTVLGDDSEALGRLTPEDLSFLFTM